jgi:hypothetical protein
MKVVDLPDNEDICKYLLRVPANIKQSISPPIDTAYLVRCSYDGKGIYISHDPPTQVRRVDILVRMIPTDIFHWEVIDADTRK